MKQAPQNIRLHSPETGLWLSGTHTRTRTHTMCFKRTKHSWLWFGSIHHNALRCGKSCTLWTCNTTHSNGREKLENRRRGRYYSVVKTLSMSLWRIPLHTLMTFRQHNVFTTLLLPLGWPASFLVLRWVPPPPKGQDWLVQIGGEYYRTEYFNYKPHLQWKSLILLVVPNTHQSLLFFCKNKHL